MLFYNYTTKNETLCDGIDKSSEEDTGACTNGKSDTGNGYCKKLSNERKLKWHEFDWKSYIAKDLKTTHRYRVRNNKQQLHT